MTSDMHADSTSLDSAGHMEQHSPHFSDGFSAVFFFACSTQKKKTATQKKRPNAKKKTLASKKKDLPVGDRGGCGALGGGGGARWAGCGAGGVRLGARQRCPFPLWGGSRVRE